MSINLTWHLLLCSLWTLEKVVLYDVLVAKATSIHSWSLLIREDVLSVIFVVSIIHALYFLPRLCCGTLLQFRLFKLLLCSLVSYLILLFDLSGGTTSCLQSFYTVVVRSYFGIYSSVEHWLYALFLVNEIRKIMVNAVLPPNTVLPSGLFTQIYFEMKLVQILESFTEKPSSP